jgi:hypothetical protein
MPGRQADRSSGVQIDREIEKDLAKQPLLKANEYTALSNALPFFCPSPTFQKLLH